MRASLNKSMFLRTIPRGPVIIVAELSCLTLFVATAGADQLAGTQIAEKSKYSPGPPPKSLTVVVESDENNYQIDATGTVTESRSRSSTVRNLTERTISATGIANADTALVKRIDAITVETMQKKDGKVVMTVTTKVSKDGNTWTSTWCGKNAEGKDVHNVVVFDKK